MMRLDPRSLAVIRRIGKEADRKQCKAYLVGGIVRDLILKKKNLDLDIVVEGDAIALARVLATKLKGKLTIYKEFGTTSLWLSGKRRIDLAMARKECYKHSGALPTVQPGSLNEDLYRRDFTINAMAIAINTCSFGRLIDEFGGLRDLSERAIRVLHDRSFVDDPTRIFRAIRFEQRFSFRIERRTLRLMKEALRKKVFLNVKPPRYFNEFKKILHEADPTRCLKRLDQVGALGTLDPKLTLKSREIGLMHQRIQKVRKLPLYRTEEWWLVYLMGLLKSANGSVIKHFLTRFSFTRQQRVSIQQAQQADRKIKMLSAKGLRPSQVYRQLKSLTPETILYLRILTGCPIVNRRIDRFLTRDSKVGLCINGEDLKKIGLLSGRKMGEILEDILCLKIDRKVATKKEELKAAAAVFKQVQKG